MKKSAESIAEPRQNIIKAQTLESPKSNSFKSKIIDQAEFKRRLFLHYAKSYLNNGFSVIPIIPGTKKPYVKWKQFQQERPTEADIEKWWKEFPDAQIGIVTGRVSNLLVIDFDSHESISVFESKFGKLPETITQETKRGFHYFYFCHSNFPSKTGIFDKTDIKSEGGYVIVSPSLHDSGFRYKLIYPCTEGFQLNKLPNPPAQLIELLTTGPADKQIKKVALDLDPVPHGQRNDKLTRLVGRWLGKGLEKDEILIFAEGWNQRLPEPMGHSEVQGIVTSIHGSHLKNQPTKAEQFIRGYTAYEILNMEFPEPKWAIPGILPEGVNLLAGKPKQGKSIFALNICVAVACGGKALGQIEVQKGSVIYIAYEDKFRRIQERLKLMLPSGERSEDLKHLHVHNGWPKMNQKGIEYLKIEIEKHEDLRLIVIDTLAKFRPVGKNSQNVYDRDYQDMSRIKELADHYQVSILVIHHVRKSESEDVFEEISGSNGLTGAADGLLVMKRQSQNTILHTTGRDIEEDEYALEFGKDILTWNYLGKADEVQSSNKRQAIYDALKESEEPLSPKQISERTELKLNYIYKTLLALTKAGKIQKLDRGRYTI